MNKRILKWVKLKLNIQIKLKTNKKIVIVVWSMDYFERSSHIKILIGHIWGKAGVRGGG
jgi:hypothetical protein